MSTGEDKVFATTLVAGEHSGSEAEVTAVPLAGSPGSAGAGS